MIKDAFIKYTQMAELIDYQHMSKNEIAEGYIFWRKQYNDSKALGKAADPFELQYAESMMNAYYAAWLLRYWYKIYEWKEDSASLRLPEDEFVGWLEDSTNIIFDYCSWLDPTKDLYGDVAGPDKAMNQACKSTRGREYQYYNKDKRKANTMLYSIDAMQDENGDSALDYSGCTSNETFGGAHELVERFLRDHKSVEALIVDGYCFQDTFKDEQSSHKEKEINEETGEETEVKIIDHEYSPDDRKLIKHLTHLDPEFFNEYFCGTYGLTAEEGQNILNQMATINNSKLYKIIKKVKIQIKQSPELLSYLGYSK